MKIKLDFTIKIDSDTVKKLKKHLEVKKLNAKLKNHLEQEAIAAVYHFIDCMSKTENKINHEPINNNLTIEIK